MKFKLLTLIIALALASSALGVGSTPSPARAQVDSAEAAYVSCKEFGAAGYFSASSSRKVGIFAFNLTTGQSLAFKFIASGTSGQYGGSISFPEQPAHSLIYVDISTYVPSATDFFHGWDTEQYFFGIVDCSNSGFTGPSVPVGAELKTITCDVAVFSEPGGQPVGDNRIKAGQTWFVLPGATADAKGEKWVQVFVSGFGLPWIPARCVPGASTAPKTKSAPAASAGSVLTASNSGGLKPATAPNFP